MATELAEGLRFATKRTLDAIRDRADRRRNGEIVRKLGTILSMSLVGLVASGGIAYGSAAADANTSRTFRVLDAYGGPREVRATRAASPRGGAPTWRYQTDLVAPSDIMSADGLVSRVELNIRTGTRGCADVDSCAGGVRKTSGYTWFQALSVEVGATADQNVAGLHAGLALGGSGASAQWYFDWSGYWGPDSAQDGVPLGSPLGHGISLSEATWYRIRISRVACAGGTWGYKALIRPLSSTSWRNAGKFCVGAADRIAKAYYFTEIIELGDVCTTDFLYGQDGDLSYYVGSTKHAFAHAWGVYVDDSCTNTNLRITTGTGTIDVRGVTRGKNGGITQSWQQLW